MTASDLGPVRIIGVGLIGGSLGLALSQRGMRVQLADTSPSALALARDLGVGELISAGDNSHDDAASGAGHGEETPASPRLIVVATPPDVTAEVVVDQLKKHRDAIVTDVASVKAEIGDEVIARAGDDARRYVGSHPMAGRELSGVLAADAQLFVGRPWVIVPGEASKDAIRTVRELILEVGALPATMSAADHDAAVALISHLPQITASLTAARLRGASEQALSLAGQGLRDVTRIANSDPRLWASIIAGNAAQVRRVLNELRDDLDALSDALGEVRPGVTGPDAKPGVLGAIATVVGAGNQGVARIPGKHGGAQRTYYGLTVLVPDKPGELARLFADVGSMGINIEDLYLEHAQGQAAGLARLLVAPASGEKLKNDLHRRGWRTVGNDEGVSG